MGSSSGIRRAWGVLAVVLCLLGGAGGVGAQGSDVEGFKTQVFTLLNEQRAANGLPPLRRVVTLETAAQLFSDTMRRATAGGPVYLSHNSPDGTSAGDRITRAGYAWFTYGENIAAGQRTPQEVVSAWMNSAGHRANILNAQFRDVGIGLAVGPGTWPNGFTDPQVRWWTTDFGSSSVTYPPPAGGAAPTPAAAPAITSYTATNGTPINSAPPGDSVVIVGVNLGRAGTVRFNGIDSPAAASWTPTAITAIVPAATAYPSRGSVTVLVNGSRADGPEFTITQPGAASPSPLPSTPATPTAPSTSAAAGPVITGIADLNGTRLATVPGGTIVVLQGHGFGENPSGRGLVVFTTSSGRTRAASVYGWRDDTIKVGVPSLSGPVLVSAFVPAGGGWVRTNRVPLTIGTTTIAAPQTREATASPTGGPVITGLADDLQNPISTVNQGDLFTIRGRGFGTNEAGTGRVLFLSNGAELAGLPLLWSDETIAVAAPYVQGPVELLVQVDAGGTLVDSNRTPLAIQ